MRRTARLMCLLLSCLLLLVTTNCSKHERLTGPAAGRLGRSGTATPTELQLPDDPGGGSIVLLNEDFTYLNLFTSNNPFKVDVSTWTVHDSSATWIQYLATHGDTSQHMVAYFGSTRGLPYIGVGADQARLTVVGNPTYGISDAGPYPIPDAARTTPGYMEGAVPGGTDSTDSHLFVVDRDSLKLYELWAARWDEGLQQWTAGFACVWNLGADYVGQTHYWGNSASCSGLPMFPAFVRYDEASAPGAINHGFGVSVWHTYSYQAPATHYSYNLSYVGAPPMGARLRLKNTAEVNAKIALLAPKLQKVFQAMQKYGVIIMDDTGNVSITAFGTQDGRWPQATVGYLTIDQSFYKFTALDFEVVTP
jgi:hypothetical protein